MGLNSTDSYQAELNWIYYGYCIRERTIIIKENGALWKVWPKSQKIPMCQIVLDPSSTLKNNQINIIFLVQKYKYVEGGNE